MTGNHRRVLVCFLTVLGLLLLPKEGLGFSIQLHGGAGKVEHAGLYKSEEAEPSYSQFGLDAFFYEGKYLHLFIGSEYTNYSTEDRIGNEYIKYSTEIVAATFGLRLLAPTKGKWQPYASLRGIAGRVKYDINQYTDRWGTELEPTSISEYYLTLGGGLGVDIGISKSYSLGIEARIAHGPVSGKINNYIEFNRGTNMFGLNLGLRYYF